MQPPTYEGVILDTHVYEMFSFAVSSVLQILITLA
jgi:hypothetical protein